MEPRNLMFLDNPQSKDLAMDSTPSSDYSQDKDISSTEIDETFEIFEEKPDHHFRTELPNIIFELGFDIYTRDVYRYIKQITGDYGRCFKSYKTMTQELGISETKLKECIKTLEKPHEKLGGLSPIKVTRRFNKKENKYESNLIQVVDVWRVNGDFYRRGGVGRQETQGGSPGASKQDLFKKRSSAPAKAAHYDLILKLLDSYNFSESSLEKFIQLPVKTVQAVLSSCGKKNAKEPIKNIIGYVHQALMQKYKDKDKKTTGEPVKQESEDEKDTFALPKETVEFRIEQAKILQSQYADFCKEKYICFEITPERCEIMNYVIYFDGLKSENYDERMESAIRELHNLKKQMDKS
jgi:hypothetical protein